MQKQSFCLIFLFTLVTFQTQELQAQSGEIATNEQRVSVFSGPVFNTIDTALALEGVYSSALTFHAWKDFTTKYDVGFLFWSKQSNNIVHRNYATYFVAKREVYRLQEKIELNVGAGPAVNIISSKYEAAGQGSSDNSDLKLGGVLIGEGRYNWQDYLDVALKLRFHIAPGFRSFETLFGLTTRLP